MSHIASKHSTMSIVTSWIRWTERIVCNHITTFVIMTAIAVLALAFRFIGLGRSLWLDEAWVANSVTAKSLAGMFYYDSWLQTSPPLFLLMVRATVYSLGLTSSVLRLVPLFSGILSGLGMFILLRRVLSEQFVRPAWTMFVFAPAAILYSKTLKQYSLELAAATAVLLVCILYLEHPTIRRFWLLLATIVVGIPMSYSVPFLSPGIILLVCISETQSGSAVRASTTLGWSGLMRGLVLATFIVAMFIGVYLLFVSPNTSSSLYAYWGQDHGDSSLAHAALADAYGLLYQLPIPYRLLVQQKFMSAAAGVFLIVGFILACLRFRSGTQKWLDVQVICATPCFLLIICDVLSLYPMTGRTSLFLLPALVLVIMCNLQLIINFVLHRTRQQLLRPAVDIALGCMTVLIACVGIARQPTGALSMPEEDMASTLSFLRANVDEEDLLWVHASCSESFKLYKKIIGWDGASVKFGNTGWPCCPRKVPSIKGPAERMMSAVTLTTRYLSTSREKYNSYIRSGAPTGNLSALMNLTLRNAFFVSEVVFKNQHLFFTTSELLSSLVTRRVDYQKRGQAHLPQSATPISSTGAPFHKKLDDEDRLQHFVRQEWHTLVRMHVLARSHGKTSEESPTFKRRAPVKAQRLRRSIAVVESPICGT